MGLFDNFPYTNFHELNLMWILEALKEIQTTTEQFVALNSLKYADPIQWNIVSQYEKNTIVIDPQTGTAYISVQPVPTGVALTNTDYWTVVFDLGSFVTRAAQNFTTRWEADTTLTATFPTLEGEWLVWGDTLYKAKVNITAGDQYVVDSNIQRITVEEVKNEIYSIMGALADLNTIDKSNLVAAINEVLQTLSNTTGDLADLNTTDKSNLVSAINEVFQTLSDTVGDLDDLDTTDKSNLVSAINETFTALSNLGLRSVLDYGAKGDGITDDSAAFQAAVDSLPYGSIILIPTGTYLLSDLVTIPTGKRLTFIGESGSVNGSVIKYTSAGAFLDNGDGSSFNRLCFLTAVSNPTSGCAIEYLNTRRAIVDDCLFYGGWYGIHQHEGSDLNIDRCTFLSFTPESDGFAYCIKLGTDGYSAPVQIRDCLFRNLIGSESHCAINCDYTDGVIISGCTINSFCFGVTIDPTSTHISAYNYIDNCVIDNCINHTIYIHGSATTQVWRSRVSNCWIGQSGWTDVTIIGDPSSNVKGIIISNNHFAASPISLNIQSAGTAVHEVVYSDNIVEGATSTAIQLTLDGNFIKIHDNIFITCNRCLSGNNYASVEYYNNTQIDSVNDNIYGNKVRAGANSGLSWQTYTPTISAGHGTIDSYTLNDAKFDIVENRVMFIVDVTINTATTASDLLVSMPRACDSNAFIPVRINNTNGNAYCSAGYATLVIYKYDGDGSINNGNHYYIEGCYDLRHDFIYQ